MLSVYYIVYFSPHLFFLYTLVLIRSKIYYKINQKIQFYCNALKIYSKYIFIFSYFVIHSYVVLLQILDVKNSAANVYFCSRLRKAYFSMRILNMKRNLIVINHFRKNPCTLLLSGNSWYHLINLHFQYLSNSQLTEPAFVEVSKQTRSKTSNNSTFVCKSSWIFFFFKF